MTTIRDLFPRLVDIGKLPPQEAIILVKLNEKVDGVSTISELIDAYWWCLYSWLYNSEEKRSLISDSWENYIDDETRFNEDLILVLKCDTIRLAVNTHRYEIPKKLNQKKKKQWYKKVEEHEALLEGTLHILITHSEPEIDNIYSYRKMCVDMIRCNQEYLIGCNPDSVSNQRDEQYENISNLLDAVIVHRNIVEKCIEFGGELLTPEEADIWAEAKNIIKTVCNRKDTPGFISKLTKMPSFIKTPIS